MTDITNLPLLRYISRRIREFSDERILARVKKGNTQDFGVLYLRYVDKIYRYLFFRVGQNKDTAEDLTQVVFLKGFEKIKTFDEKKGTLQSWFFRIAHNSLVDHYRSTLVKNPLSDNLASDENLEEEVQNKMDIENIQKSLDFLTPEQKEVILMRFVEDMSYSEISKVLAKNESAVRAIQYRALKVLKNKFKNHKLHSI